MTETDINTIYDRLYDIAPKLEIRSIPNPRYISEKLGECHLCMDEVGKFHNRVNKELSILKRAFNNADVAFSIEKDNLITNDEDIISLPSSKDREARANTKLKDKINELKTYKNEIDCLENLRDTINVKLKDLTRLNADVKSQLRVMEAQIKLGTGGVGTETGLMDELKKTALGKDVWEGVESTVTEEKIIDPSAPISPDTLVWGKVTPGTQPEDPFAELERLVEIEVNNQPIPEASPVIGVLLESAPIEEVNKLSISENNQVTEQQIISEVLLDTVNNLSVQGASPEGLLILDEIISDNSSKIENKAIDTPVVDEVALENEAADNESDEEVETTDSEQSTEYIPEDDVFGSDVSTIVEDNIKPEPELDLDKILNPNPSPSINPITGGVPEVIINEKTIIKEESKPEKTQEPVKQNTNGISFFDDLLAQFQ